MDKLMYYRYDSHLLSKKALEESAKEYLDREKDLVDEIDTIMSSVLDNLFIEIEGGEKKDVRGLNPDTELWIDTALSESSIYQSFKANGYKNLASTAWNNFIQKLFCAGSISEHGHIMLDCMEYWMVSRFVADLTKDDRFCDISILLNILERGEMIHGLYNCLLESIPNEWFARLKTAFAHIETKVERMLDYFAIKHEDTSLDVVRAQYDGKISPWNFVSELSRYSDYIMLAEDYAFKSAVIARHDFKDWFGYWINMRYPAIQNSMLGLATMRAPESYACLLHILEASSLPKEQKRILGLIVAKNWVLVSTQISERMSAYADDTKLKASDEDFLKKGKAYYDDWEKEKFAITKDIISSMLSVEPVTDVEDWVFSYKFRGNKFSVIYDENIKMLVSIYENLTKGCMPNDFTALNIRKFNMYASKIETADKDKCSQLLDAMASYISSDKFLWDGNISSKESKDAFTHVARLILRDDDPEEKAFSLIENFCVKHQGWNVHLPEYRDSLREAFVLDCVAYIFLQTEGTEKIKDKKVFFERFCNKIIQQVRFSLNKHQSYTKTLSLTYWITSQLSDDARRNFQRKVIMNVDDLVDVLYVLGLNHYTMENDTIAVLCQRIKEELPLIENAYSNRTQDVELSNIRNLVSNLLPVFKFE